MKAAVGYAFYLSIFVTIFLAELADKTQLATMSYSLQHGASRFGIFLAASLALILSTGLAVLLSGLFASYMNTLPLTRISGALFILIGVVTLVRS